MIDVEGFIHTAPDGYHYETVRQKSTLTAIWIVSDRRWIYNDGAISKSIWGFYKPKTRTYHAPINSKRVGDQVNIEDTTPYSAMQLNLTPLERCFC